MKLRWKTLFVQVVIWAVSEVALNCVGMDDLADYSEFILDRKQTLIEAISESTWAMNPTRSRIASASLIWFSV